MTQEKNPEAIPSEDASFERSELEILIKGIGAGEKEAFCTFYKRTKKVLFSYALSILRNKDDAEDAVQDTCLKIRSAAHLYQPMGKPLAWILTIERNICLMQLRSRSRFSDSPLEEAPERDPDTDSRSVRSKDLYPYPLSGEEASPLYVSASSSLPRTKDAENQMMLQKALKSLSQEESSIVLLHAAAGIKHREIAQHLNLPLSTVLSKYRRALAKLRLQLQEPVP